MSKLLDANAILRYLLDDIPDQASVTEQAINDGAFTIGEVLSEVVYVLQGVYKLDRKDISDSIRSLLKEIDIENKLVIKEALDAYENTSLDYVDCLLYARAKLFREPVVSFDKKLNSKIKQI